MLQGLFLMILLGPILVSGTFTCMGSDWVLDGSKCLKLIAGSPKDGQAQCSIEDSSAKLVLPPNSQEAADAADKFPNKTIWVGLRFQNGEAWNWDDGSEGTINWDSPPQLPQLCIGIFGLLNSYTGYMYDRFCYSQDGVICQAETNVSGFCESGWTFIGTRCYKGHSTEVVFSDARTICSNENAMVIMPQSQSEAEMIITTLNLNLADTIHENYQSFYINERNCQITRLLREGRDFKNVE